MDEVDEEIEKIINPTSNDIDLLSNANEKVRVLKEENEILKKALRLISSQRPPEYHTNKVNDQYKANTYFAGWSTAQKKAKSALKEVKGDK